MKETKNNFITIEFEYLIGDANCFDRKLKNFRFVRFVFQTKRGDYIYFKQYLCQKQWVVILKWIKKVFTLMRYQNVTR